MVFAILFASSGNAFAASDHKHPCAEDIKKHCKDVKPGDGRVIQCLDKLKDDDLSPSCRQQRTQAKAIFDGLKVTCKEDHEKLCAGKEHHELMRCMKENREKISAGCKKASHEAHEKFKALRDH